MFFFNKKSRENEVSELFIRHAEGVGRTLESMKLTFERYLAGDASFVEQSRITHETEHEADEVADLIRQKLYEGAFLQGLRADFAAMLGKMEKVAGHAVICCRILSEERPAVADEVKPDILAMAAKTAECAPHLAAAFRALDGEITEVATACKAIHAVESEVDALLHKLITKLYKLDIDLARKIQTKDLLIYMHRISDYADEFSNVIATLAMNIRI